MKKLTEFSNYLLDKIIILFIIIGTITTMTLFSNGQSYQQKSIEADSVFNRDIKYTKKMFEQSQRIERLDSVADSINIKWDMIEKKINEKNRVRSN